MILLHDTAGNEIAVRACDISCAERVLSNGALPLHTRLYAVQDAAWVDLTVTETPAEIVAMMRNDAKGWA